MWLLGCFKRRHILIIAVIFIIVHSLCRYQCSKFLPQLCQSAGACSYLPASTLWQHVHLSKVLLREHTGTQAHQEEACYECSAGGRLRILGNLEIGDHAALTMRETSKPCIEPQMHHPHHKMVQMGERYLNIADAAHSTSKAGPKVAAPKIGEVLEVTHVKILVGACLVLLILIHPFVPVHLLSRHCVDCLT